MNNNDDDNLNDDFQSGPDSDHDADFGEFDQDEQKGSLGDLVKKNPAVKIGLVVAALLVVIGAITLFGGSADKAPNSVVPTGKDDFKEIPGQNEVSPEMKEVIDEYNQQNLEEAVNKDGSFIPQSTETSKTKLELPAEESQTEDPLKRWRDMQDERLKTQATEQNAQKQAEDPAKAQALQALSTAMNTQMSQILTTKKTDSIKTMEVTNLQALLDARQKALQDKRDQAAANTLTNGQQQTTTTIDPMTGQPVVQNLTPAKVLLPAGAIEYAQLLIEANSDVEGPIVAMIVSGPFSGSRALGTFTTKEKLLVLQFNTLIDKKGVSIPIQAFALDPDTTLTGMATDIDNRYWERIILPAAADFVEGMGEAYADKQGNTTVVTGDVVVQEDPPIDVEEQVAAGVQKAAERVGEILSEEGDNTKALIRVRAGTPMGILFMQAITDQDRVAGINSPTTARTLAQQQQQQSLLQQQLQGNQANNPMYLIQGLQNAQQQMQTTNQPEPNAAGFNGSTSSNIFSTQQYLEQQNK